MEQHNKEHLHENVDAERDMRGGAQAGSPAWLLPASILVAAVLISGSLIYMTQSNRGAAQPGDGVPAAGVAAQAPASEERDAILGDPDAPVTVIAYEDFQCPFCAQYVEETESQIRTAYVETGKAKLVYRHLAFLGPESVAAAAASECAKDQGKFWEFHDAVFEAEIADATEHNGNLKRSLFMQIAKTIGLDEAAFASCVDGKKYDAYVEAQTQEAGTKYGVNSTPTVFVNDQKVEGAYPFSEFQRIIESILNG